MYRDTEDKFELYMQISIGITISQEMLKQTVNKNNIHIRVGVSQVSQLVVMISLINECYVVYIVVIKSCMNFVLYRNNQCYVPSFHVNSLACSLYSCVPNFSFVDESHHFNPCL